MKYHLSPEAARAAGTHVVLAADIGATKTNLALFKKEGEYLISLKEGQFRSVENKNMIALADSFIRDTARPDTVCFGIAGPVVDGHAKMSNIDIELDRKDMAAHFQMDKIYLINDLEATAFGIQLLDEKHLLVMQKGDAVAKGNMAVIAPGTGLGEAGMYWDGKRHHPFATEGGHSDFAVHNDFDFELYRYLQSKYNHVSWERLISGPGIVNIYDFLHDELKREEPGWLKEKFQHADKAAVISHEVSQCEICKVTMQLFVRYLARESANLVLKLKATGGLFIGGGIAPHLTDLFRDNIFHATFCASGRLNYLLEKVPVKIIMDTRTALIGAACYGMKIDSQ